MARKVNHYNEGKKYGKTLRELRDAGDNFDCRYHLADLAKTLSSEDFDAYMRGLEDGMKRKGDDA